jgi:hypothetical protein
MPATAARTARQRRPNPRRRRPARASRTGGRITAYGDDATRDVHTGVDSKAARVFASAVRAVARRKLDPISGLVAFY